MPTVKKPTWIVHKTTTKWTQTPGHTYRIGWWWEVFTVRPAVSLTAQILKFFFWKTDKLTDACFFFNYNFLLFVLDTFVVVAGYQQARVELFTLSSSKWQNKNNYPYSKDLYAYSIIAVEKKYVVFGGSSRFRKGLTNQDKKFMKIQSIAAQ